MVCKIQVLWLAYLCSQPLSISGYSVNFSWMNVSGLIIWSCWYSAVFDLRKHFHMIQFNINKWMDERDWMLPLPFINCLGFFPPSNIYCTYSTWGCRWARSLLSRGSLPRGQEADRWFWSVWCTLRESAPKGMEGGIHKGFREEVSWSRVLRVIKC